MHFAYTRRTLKLKSEQDLRAVCKSIVEQTPWVSPQESQEKEYTLAIISFFIFKI